MGADGRAHPLAQARPGLQLGGELADLLDPELSLRQHGVRPLQPAPQPPEIALLHRGVGVLALRRQQAALGRVEDRKQDVGHVDRRIDVERLLGIDHDRQQVGGVARREPSRQAQQLGRLAGAGQAGEELTGRLVGQLDAHRQLGDPVDATDLEGVEVDVALVARGQLDPGIAAVVEKAPTSRVHDFLEPDLYHSRSWSPNRALYLAMRAKRLPRSLRRLRPRRASSGRPGIADALQRVRGRGFAW